MRHNELSANKDAKKTDNDEGDARGRNEPRYIEKTYEDIHTETTEVT